MRPHQPPFRLREVKLEVTDRCTLACIHCSSEASPSCSREMPFGKAAHLLDEMLALGVSEIVFSGGEPLLWPGLYDAVRKCADRGVRPTIYTSGNVDGCDVAMSLLKEHGAGCVIFSLFGAHKDAHDRVTRQKGSFDETLAAIEAARKASLRIELHFVPMGANYGELPRIIDLARDKRLSRVSVLRLVPQGRAAVQPSMALTHDQNLELRRMIEAGRDNKMDVRAGSPYNFLLVNESPKCCAAIDRLTVGPQFNIYPCDAFKQIEGQELADTDDLCRVDRWSLEECWQKSPYLREVRNYLTTDFEPPCDSCELLQRCLSGCLAQKVIAHGALKKAPDPMCLKLRRC
jgi:radical SAM protein with 4Fe4S-binding SPASM domain